MERDILFALTEAAASASKEGLAFTVPVIDCSEKMSAGLMRR
jgi:hypothetical protein